MVNYWIVWNEDRSEGVVTSSERDAQACVKGRRRTVSSALCDEFADMYDDQTLTLQPVGLPA